MRGIQNTSGIQTQAQGADDFGDRHVRFIFTNEPEDRLDEAANRIAAFVGRHYPLSDRPRET